MALLYAISNKTSRRFFWRPSTALIFIMTIVVILQASDSEAASLDCRRFVFAPACRGATIKRSQQPPRRNYDFLNDDSNINEVPQGVMEVMDALPIVEAWIDRVVPHHFKLLWPKINKLHPKHSQITYSSGEESDY